jgi:RNA-binding protein Nova
MEYENKTGAQVKVSPTRTFFPTTNERMIMISGEFDQIRAMFPFVLLKLQEHGMEPSNMLLRVVIPTVSVAAIIGKGGDIIKDLQNRTGARIHVCERIDGLPEAIVEVKGEEPQVVHGATVIMEIIQSETRLKDLAGQYYGQHYTIPRPEYKQQQYYEREPPPPPRFEPPPPVDPTSNPDLLMYPITIHFVVPISAAPYIVGEEARSIKQYFRETGATVTVDEQPLPGTEDVNVSISGPLCGVQAAHILVIKQVADAFMAAHHR